MALDVASGTGHLALALAPRVKRMVCVDLTKQMLMEAQRTATTRQIDNVVFLRAVAERLPFPNSGFDLVTCRFAVHHFAEPEVQLREMLRVLAAGGGVTIIDLVAPDGLEDGYNHHERLRDPSHTRALTFKELLDTVGAIPGITVAATESREVDVDVERWLSLTRTPPETAEAIRAAIRTELAGGPPTGLRAFAAGSNLMFRQTWAVITARYRDDQQATVTRQPVTRQP